MTKKTKKSETPKIIEVLQERMDQQMKVVLEDLRTEKQEDKIFNLEFGIEMASNDLDEIAGLLRMLKSYVMAEDFSKYTAGTAIDGILTSLANTNMDLMERLEK